MRLRKVRPLVFGTLVALFSLGVAPVAQAEVEMTVDPYAIFTSPGWELSFTLTMINHDRCSYNCRLELELRTQFGWVIHYPDRYFSLQPLQTVSREVTRTVPRSAPAGEHVLWFFLYDEDTGRELATTHCHIHVGWDSF